MTHDPRHTEALQAAIEGRLAPASPEWRARLASCAECAEAWAEHQALVRGMRSAGKLRERVLAEARSIVDAPGAAEAEAALLASIRREPANATPSAAREADDSAEREGERSAVRGDELSSERERDPSAEREEGDLAVRADEHNVPRALPRRPRPRRRWTWLALAAVVLAVLGLAWQRGVFDPKPTQLRPLGSELECVSPTVLERSDVRFEWSKQFASTTKLTLFLEGRASDDAPWVAIDHWSTLTGKQWRPPARTSANWPAQLRWRVEANDDTLDLQVDSGWASLTLLH